MSEQSSTIEALADSYADSLYEGDMRATPSD
jgi:hypothetical protein